VKLAERRQEAFLHCVLRISRIPQDRHSDLTESRAARGK
jgi:hypothetical protein